MRKIIFLIGISGSGKSTFTKKYIKENDTIVINRDSLRKSIFGDNYLKNGYYDNPNINFNEELINKLIETLLLSVSNSECNIIIDNTNLKISYINSIKEIVNEFFDNYTFEHILFETENIEINKKRILLRDGEDTDVSYIDKQYEQYKTIKDIFNKNYRFKTIIN